MRSKVNVTCSKVKVSNAVVTEKSREGGSSKTSEEISTKPYTNISYSHELVGF